MNASIVAVGTEITDGQILNRNSLWLSEQLKRLGARVTLHLAVPDHREKIFNALAFAEREGKVVFVTGGLGPTSDDFTRDLVGEWAQTPLEFHPLAWEKVQERLSTRGYPTQEFQKQQCYFPKGAQILWNANGTAHAFYFLVRGVHTFVLPGPPQEIEGIWQDNIENIMAQITQHLDPIETFSWDVLGIGESQVAALVEPLLNGKNFEIGYRVHLPYVEFKLSAPRSRKKELQQISLGIENAIGKWVCLRNGDDIASIFLQKLMGKKIGFSIRDGATKGVLAKRLISVQSKSMQPQWMDQIPWSIEVGGPDMALDENINANETKKAIFGVYPKGEFEITASSLIDGQQKDITLKTTIVSPAMASRRAQQFAELCLIEWSAQI